MKLFLLIVLLINSIALLNATCATANARRWNNGVVPYEIDTNYSYIQIDISIIENSIFD